MEPWQSLSHHGQIAGKQSSCGFVVSFFIIINFFLIIIQSDIHFLSLSRQSVLHSLKSLLDACFVATRLDVSSLCFNLTRRTGTRYVPPPPPPAQVTFSKGERWTGGQDLFLVSLSLDSIKYNKDISIHSLSLLRLIRCVALSSSEVTGWNLKVVKRTSVNEPQLFFFLSCEAYVGGQAENKPRPILK